jgi:hypothetical protein
MLDTKPMWKYRFDATNINTIYIGEAGKAQGCACYAHEESVHHIFLVGGLLVRLVQLPRLFPMRWQSGKVHQLRKL